MSNKTANENPQPKRPRWGINWILTLIVLAVTYYFFLGDGAGLRQGQSVELKASYTEFKQYVEAGYAQSVEVNKNDGTLKMYVPDEHIKTVFGKSKTEAGEKPYVSVEYGSLDELESYLSE